MTTALDYCQDPFDYRWTIAAFDAVQAGTLVAEVRTKGSIRTAFAHGACPRCDHPFTFDYILDAAANSGGLLGYTEPKTSLTVPLPVGCACGKDHPGGPPDPKGCGVVFTLQFSGDDHD